MLMEGGADKRLRKRGINGKEPEGPEGQAPRKTGGNGGKEGNGERGGARERRNQRERGGTGRSQNKNTKRQ